MEFIFLFLYRSISGLQNGAGYGKHKTVRGIATIILMLMLVSFWIMSYAKVQYGWIILAVFFLWLLSFAGIMGVENAFTKRYTFITHDIHFWEILATGGITIGWGVFGGNLIYIATSVYPALILHKGFVNTLNGGDFFRSGTDDPTGKTFGVPFLGIKIRRLGTKGRIILAVISIAAFVVSFILNIDISIFDIWHKIF